MGPRFWAHNNKIGARIQTIYPGFYTERLRSAVKISEDLTIGV